MDRRRFLQAGAGVGAVAVGGLPVRVAQAQADDWSIYDITGREPDANGLILPEGFTSRVVAHSNEQVEGADYFWHVFPDGGATFETDDGGWIYASNSEVPGDAGGVGALRFDSDGNVVDAYRILEGTSGNCAGGATPWGTWLSCEEQEDGRVWECDPTKAGQGTVLPALGTFVHEAVAVDDEGQRLFLTEDRPDGRFYRFTPANYPDLSEGDLEVGAVGDDGQVTWLPVPDPTAASAATRTQVPDSTGFDGGEGIVVSDGAVFFTTKGDDRVWRYDLEENTVEVVYDGSGTLRGVDNITVTPAGDLLVAEDGDDLELMLVAPDGRIQPMLRCTDAGSEVTGPAFDPSGTRLYFSSQRGGPAGVGRTFEVTGPFGTAAASTDSTPSTTAGSAAGAHDGHDDGGSDWLVPAIGGGAAVLVGAAAVWRLRTRTASSQ